MTAFLQAMLRRPGATTRLTIPVSRGCWARLHHLGWGVTAAERPGWQGPGDPLQRDLQPLSRDFLAVGPR